MVLWQAVLHLASKPQILAFREKNLGCAAVSLSG